MSTLTKELQAFQDQMQSALAGVTGCTSSETMGEQTYTKYRHVDDATLHTPYTGSASAAADSQAKDVPMSQPSSWKAVLHATSSSGGSGGTMAGSSSSGILGQKGPDIKTVDDVDDVDPAP